MLSVHSNTLLNKTSFNSMDFSEASVYIHCPSLSSIEDKDGKLQNFFRGLQEKLLLSRTSFQSIESLVNLFRLIVSKENFQIKQTMNKKKGYFKRFFLSENWEEWAENRTALGKTTSLFFDYLISQKRLDIFLERLDVEIIEKANLEAAELLEAISKDIQENKKNKIKNANYSLQRFVWNFIKKIDKKISSMMPFIQGVSAAPLLDDPFEDCEAWKQMENEDCQFSSLEKTSKNSELVVFGFTRDEEVLDQKTQCFQAKAIEIIRTNFIKTINPPLLNQAFNLIQSFKQSSNSLQYCESQLIALLKQFMQPASLSEDKMRSIFNLLSLILNNPSFFNETVMCFLTEKIHDFSKNALISNKTELSSRDIYDEAINLLLSSVKKFPQNNVMLVSLLKTGEAIFSRLNSVQKSNFSKIAKCYVSKYSSEENLYKKLNAFSESSSNLLSFLITVALVILVYSAVKSLSLQLNAPVVAPPSPENANNSGEEKIVPQEEPRENIHYFFTPKKSLDPISPRTLSSVDVSQTVRVQCPDVTDPVGIITLNNQQPLCTGFLITQRRAMTVGYCDQMNVFQKQYDEHGADRYQIVLGYDQEEKNRPTPRVYPVKEIQFYSCDDNSHVVALFELNSTAAYEEFGKFTLQEKYRLHQQIIVPYHPNNDKTKKLSTGAIAGHYSSRGLFGHTADVIGSSPGAPIISQNSKKVIGVHIGESNEENYALGTVAFASLLK